MSGARPFAAAMADYQAIRDRQVLPMYELTCQLATLQPPPPELQRLLAAAHGNQEAMDAFARVMAGVTSPTEFFSEQNMGRILALAGTRARRPRPITPATGARATAWPAMLPPPYDRSLVAGLQHRARPGVHLERSTMEQTPTRVTCCIAGCGPAGAMLGLLLARAGVDVLVLEKHGDFLRDFRGDTLHPSTLRLFDELGLAEGLLRLPHQEVQQIGVSTDAGEFTLADFGRLPGPYRFLAFMPQWDFLDFVVGRARRLASFELRMEAEAVEVLEEPGRVTGVVYRDRDGAVHRVRARLTVAADGRDSELRGSAGLRRREFGVPIDVLWFRLPRRPTDPMTFGRLAAGHLLVLIDRGAYWQIAYVIPKDAADELHQTGLDRLRASVAELVPFLADRVEELRTWDDLRTLRVQVDRLRRWFRPGLLCIGDAAHAMSPIGGVGINLAVHDAVAAANLLAGPLRDGTLATRDLARVQLRRLLPTVVIQRLQRTIQDRFLSPLLAGRVPAKGPLALRVLRRFPVLQAVPALVIGIGVLPEHVRTPALQDPADEGGLAGVLEVVGDHADQPHPEGDRRVP